MTHMDRLDAFGRPRTTAQVSLRITPDLRRRLRIASAEEGLSYAGLFTMLLDMRDERLRRQRAAMAHPLHQAAR